MTINYVSIIYFKVFHQDSLALASDFYKNKADLLLRLHYVNHYR